ncbi:hypothetical protein HJG60_008707 [Phyllostomus discolor]|uniref:Uncharacterized protein n=1 Tax=Phyllostomus discolor TaxID=89673 RepID=A0A833YW98_9CHIR|nr:hypothetical protein HJG60_008707 [Phyllostomus discolor]
MSVSSSMLCVRSSFFHTNVPQFSRVTADRQWAGPGLELQRTQPFRTILPVLGVQCMQVPGVGSLCHRAGTSFLPRHCQVVFQSGCVGCILLAPQPCQLLLVAFLMLANLVTPRNLNPRVLTSH